MRRVQQAALPYAAAALGVAAITALIATVRPWNGPPNLAIGYVLLVLWLGARHGWPPAVAAALLAVLAYDWFFVPPYGTFWVSGPRELANLAVPLAAAPLGGPLGAPPAARGAGGPGGGAGAAA